MESPLKGRSFLSITDFTTEEIGLVLDTARRVKERPSDYADRMKRKTLAMIFQKPSLRTRVSFEAGMTQMGHESLVFSHDP